MIPDPLQLDPTTERVAVNLLRHLEWQSRGFSLIFLFADVGPALSLASWLDQRLVSMGRALQRWDAPADFVTCPHKFVDEILENLPTENPSQSALWVWLHLHPVDTQWNAARRTFLARLNERRYLLERDFRRPLVLTMPVAFKPEARAIAPDLWTVRSLSEDLRAGGGIPFSALPGEGGEASALSQTGVQLTVTAVAGAPVAQAQAEIQLPDATRVAPLLAYSEWRAAMGATPERAFLATAWRAVSELLDAGRPADAMVVAKQALDQSCQRVRAADEQGSGIRDQSIALDNVAMVAQAQGNWSEAERLYRESLEIRRQLQERLGGTPEAMDDLGVTLANLGSLHGMQDDSLLREAEQIYEMLTKTCPSVVDYSQRLDHVRRLLQK